MATRKVPPQPDANVPIVDPKTGKLTRVWREYLAAVQRYFADVYGELNP